MVYIIKNKLLQSVSYIIGNYLIDCGDGDAILKKVKENDIRIRGIFLTHCHQDHIYGIPKIMNCFPNTKVYCSCMTHKGLKDILLNLSYLMPEFSSPFVYDENVVELTEGIHFIDDLKVEMIICNGHSNDCQSFIIDDNLFTGDAFLPFAKVFTKWPTSNKVLALESEYKLRQLAKERNLIIRPGHWQ
jgi:glyoxylase-like metal-dependent hydrolase (beta-lactamase superfamily II)